jgi:ABC-type hemin transport system substrate-binding protein
MHELAGTPAWRAGRIHFVDGKAISWYGARTPAALTELSRLLGR